MYSRAMKCWAELQPYRTERLRCKNYAYGRQYLDTVTERDQRMTEEQYIKSQGNVPLKNNLIRRLVRNVLGVFRNNFRLPGADELGIEPTDAGNIVLMRRMEKLALDNNLYELYSRMMEEYLIGGMAVIRKSVEKRPGETLPFIRTDMVRPESFFFNTDSLDPRGWDVDLVGEIHNVRCDELARWLDEPGPTDAGGETRRILEVWSREYSYYWECHDRETGNIYRTESRPDASVSAVRHHLEKWRYRIFDEGGGLLREGDSPLPDGGNPYLFKAYPYIDGEIHSFVADCIDQQRYINRLITLHDWILRASSKGVLLVPDGSFETTDELQTIADQWGRFNGIITYRHREGMPMPKQVSNNSTNIGISELLQVQLKMMEDVSGVNPALQGQLASGAVSGTLYEMQTRQALTGLADILDSFRSLVTDAARRDLSLLRASE